MKVFPSLIISWPWWIIRNALNFCPTLYYRAFIQNIPGKAFDLLWMFLLRPLMKVLQSRSSKWQGNLILFPSYQFLTKIFELYYFHSLSSNYDSWTQYYAISTHYFRCHRAFLVLFTNSNIPFEFEGKKLRHNLTKKNCLNEHH